MVDKRTVLMSKEIYGTLVTIASNGTILSMINTFMMLLLCIWTRPVEVEHFSSFEITGIISTIPLYVSLLSHFIATFFFRIAYLRIRKADTQSAFSPSDPSFKQKDMEDGNDFSVGKESYIEVLRPIGSGSNQWLAFLSLGFAVSLLGVLLGVVSTIVVAVSSVDINIMFPIAAAVPQALTFLEVLLNYLMTAPHTLQHSIEPDWAEQFRKALGWRSRKSAKPQIKDNKRTQVLREINWGSIRNETFCVKLPVERACCYIMQYLDSVNATVTSSFPDKIIAEHGSWNAWDPKDIKKKVTVCLRKSDTNCCEVSVHVKLSRVYRLLFWLTVSLAFFIALVVYLFDQFIGLIIFIFYGLTILPIIVWDFFEKDAIARDLFFSFSRDDLLHQKDKGRLPENDGG